MTYDEFGSGGVGVRGCAAVAEWYPAATRFTVGDPVYYVKKASRGILERMVVKTIRVVANRRTGGRKVVLYVDTHNELWNDYDLVGYADAVELAEAYYEQVVNELNGRDRC